MKPKKIVVVGAGTSGWFVAAALKRNRPELDVTIVYDSKIPTIGVGETLAWGLLSFMQNVLGLKDEDWMNRVKATYKSAVHLSGWTSNATSARTGHVMDMPVQYLFKSPFENITEHVSRAHQDIHNHYDEYGSIVDAWYTLRQQGRLQDISGDDLSMALGEGVAFSKDNKSIKNVDGSWNVNGHFGYSYHYNAEQVGIAIGDLVGKPSGVKVIDGHVDRVELEQGVISKLHLKNGDFIEGDLFIDCSGFKRLLVSQLDYKWIDCDEFYNNSAIVTQLQYDDSGLPYRSVTNDTVLGLMNNGWRFSIPLQNRSGNGYVFNNRTVDMDTIVKEMSETIKVKDRTFREIHWTPGRYNKTAVSNCIALGLSQGFTDPFDASNLNLVCRLVIEMIKNLDITKDTWIQDNANLLNHRIEFWWRDIAMRVEGVLRLTPRRDTEHYRMLADYAKQTNLQEQFVEHVQNHRVRNYTHSEKFLWGCHTHVQMAARYGIPLPYTKVNDKIETMIRAFVTFNKLKYQMLSDEAPTVGEYCSAQPK